MELTNVPDEVLDKADIWIRTMIRSKWLPLILKNRFTAIRREKLSGPDYLVFRYIVEGHKIQVQEKGAVIEILIEREDPVSHSEKIENFLTDVIYEFLNYPLGNKKFIKYYLKNFNYKGETIYYGTVNCDFDLAGDAEMWKNRTWWNHTYLWTDGKRAYFSLVEMNGKPARVGFMQPQPGYRDRFGKAMVLDKISKLPPQELADMLRHDFDIRNAQTALRILKENLPENIDLLLNIAAETRGNMIVEGGLIKPIKISASAEDKRVVDKFLDFLEGQLEKDRPSVSRIPAIRSIAQTVFITAGQPAWRPYVPLWDPNRPDHPNQLPVPYANERVVNILISNLDEKKWSVRGEVIRWLGYVGANDFANADEIVAVLETQLIEEDKIQEKAEIKERPISSINNRQAGLRPKT